MQNIGPVTLTAGQATTFQVKGLVLQIISSGNSAGLTVQFLQGGQVAYTLKEVVTGWRMKPQGGFDKITIESATGDTISAIVTNGDIDVQITEVASTVGNTANNPVPVSLVAEPGAPVPVSVSGTVEVSGVELTATNVGISNTTANPVPVAPVQGATITDVAPVAVAAFTAGVPNQVHVRVAAAARALRFANPASAVGTLYLGGAAVTPTNAVIALHPGDVWEETLGAALDWYATSDTGTTANLQVIA
jgi:hypothetical protein